MTRTRSKPLTLSLTIGLSAVLALPTVLVPMQAQAEGPEDSATAAPVIVVTAPPAAEPAPPPPPPAPTYLAPPPPSPQLVALRQRRNSGIGMTISGYTLFGTSYLISALIGTISIDYANDVGGSGTYGRRMLIPLVGPFMAISRADSATGGLFTGLVGVVQIAGFALGSAGAIRLGRANRDLRLTADTGGLTLKF